MSSSNQGMQVTVKLFAGVRDAVGSDQLDVDLPVAATVGELRAKIAADHPQLHTWLACSRFAVGTEFAADTTVLADGDQLAWIPPVSGG
ncbi:MAG: MoaD/ThiS family protein [Planctomycetales bacterium]|nr:MoaD/ThiS family protein [Planctomycetales bacterium]